MAGSTAELIKEKLDIVEFLKGYLQLQPAGKNFKARCPFHNEKTPSFMISPERQSWHCFGCSLGGDAFAFLMRYENIEFGEALKVLAEKAGVELRRVSPAEYQQSGILYDLNRAAADFFKEEFEKAEVAKKYIDERGLEKSTVEEFELGWAPQSQESLNLFLLKKGYRPEDIVRAGLAFRNDRGLQSDRFRGRIMFPIHNHLGKIVGFTGRVLPQFDDGQFGKYVNSPETPIFNKSKLLYGFWKSKNAIRDEKAAFLVEGQMDFLMSYQAGVHYAVATSGTALTEDHLRALRRQTDQIILSFDSDAAGLAAGERAIDLSEANDFNVKVAVFTGFKDPAEAVKADPKRFLHLVTQARPAPEFYFEKYLPKTAFDYRNREHLRELRHLLGKLKNIQSPVAQSFWLKELAERAGLEEKALREEFEKVRNAPSSEVRESQVTETSPPARIFSRWALLSEHILSGAVASDDMGLVKDCEMMLAPEYQSVYDILKSGARKSEDSSIDERLHLVLLQAVPKESAEFEELKRQLRQEYLKDRRQALSKVIKEAEKKGDDTRVQSALRELDLLPAE